MSEPQATPLDAAAACVKMLSAADALLDAADRLRSRRDELLAVIAPATSVPVNRPKRKGASRA